MNELNASLVLVRERRGGVFDGREGEIEKKEERKIKKREEKVI